MAVMAVWGASPAADGRTFEIETGCVDAGNVVTLTVVPTGGEVETMPLFLLKHLGASSGCARHIPFLLLGEMSVLLPNNQRQHRTLHN